MADRHVLQIERLLPMGAIAGIFWRLWAQSRAGTSGVLAPGWITHLFKAITLYLGGCGAIAWLRTRLSPLTPPARLKVIDGPRIAASPENVGNWRDVGGLPVEGDSRRVVRLGEIFRSGDLSEMDTNPAVQTATASRRAIATVIDLRTLVETKGASDKCPGALKVAIRIGAASLDPTAQKYQGLSSGYIKPLIFNPGYLFDTVQFEKLPALVTIMLMTEPGYCDDAVKRFFVKCADKRSRPVVVHCREGKDRTGALVALLQLALGVPEHEVIRDFVLSNTLNKRKTEMRRLGVAFLWLVGGSWRSFATHGDHVTTAITVQVSTITTALHAVKDRHGGFTDEYWQAMGVSAEVLAALRADLITSPV